MKEALQIQLQEEHYKEMLARYHFNQTDIDQLRCLGEILLRTVEPVMYYAPCRVTDIGGENGNTQMADTDEKVTEKAAKNIRAAGIEAIQTDQVKEGTQLALIVSLGAKVDALQNEYVDKERLTEGYMIECIGMELLKTAYELTAEKVWAKYGLWMGGFVFLGERYPLELTEEVFRLLAPEEISYNQAYMLTPKKTVVFMTTLQKERKNGYCYVCDACSNFQCPNRQSIHRPEKWENREKRVPEKMEENRSPNLNYGYQRIFGKP